MAKLKKNKDASASGSSAPAGRVPRATDADRQDRLDGVRRALRRLTLHLALALALFVALAFLVASVKGYVEKRLVFPSEPPRVVLKNQPDWMTDELADRIRRAARPQGTHSAFDYQMLLDTADMLTRDEHIAPWISKVKQIRRAFGQGPGDTLELDCEFRAPAALVRWRDYYWLVDADGIKLPGYYQSDQVPRILYTRDRRVNIRLIEGVVRPPPEAGRKWLGDDLAAGIDLARYIAAKPYTEEVIKINVANFGGRADPRAAQLVLVTKDQTEILWGRPVNAKDLWVEVDPQFKLAYLQKIVEKFHRVDGNHSAVDIRFDKVTFPSDDPRTAVHRVEADGRE